MVQLSDDATVSFVRAHRLSSLVAEATGLSASSVSRAMRESHGNALLKNVFHGSWPLGFTVARVREEGLHSQVAVAAGLTVSQVRSALERGDGRRLARTALFDSHGNTPVPPTRPPRSTAPSVQVRTLIIGNEKYEQAPLNNPAKDASDFARVARSIGYTVDTHIDLGCRKMDKVIRDFGAQLTSQDGVLFYYSGHGAECEDDNWLLPVDCDSDDDRALTRQSVPMRDVFKAFKRAKFRIMILDACRNNPFRGMSRGSTGGLGTTSLTGTDTEGDLVCLATGPRQTADDGRPGGNGVWVQIHHGRQLIV